MSNESKKAFDADNQQERTLFKGWIVGFTDVPTSQISTSIKVASVSGICYLAEDKK